MENLITTLIKINPRIGFRFEHTLFTYGNHFMKDYDGGLWTPFSDHCMWMDMEGVTQAQNTQNYSDGGMSIRSLSVGISLMALNHLTWQYSASAHIDQLVDAYHHAYTEVFREENEEKIRLADVAAFID